jgi:hypothetical protein
MRELVQGVARGVVDKFQAETPLFSLRYGIVTAVPGTGGQFPVVLVRVDGPDVASTPAECACAVPTVGARVALMFPPPHGCVVLFPTSGVK